LIVLFIASGIKTLQEHIGDYQKGITDFVNLAGDLAKKILPKDMADHMREKVGDYLSSALPNIASTIISTLGSLGGYFLFFFIYLCFWIFEPLPINSKVSQVFKTYLFMKTIVCFLFASMMAILLICLECPLWQLFFVVTFLLNYIPEVGPILAALLMTPAVLFDGRFDMHGRLVHFVWLAILGVLFKIITGNFIEVNLYANRGGQFMRMHPVFLMATMMIFYVLMGITGMFLSIPIVAAMKYYLLSSRMPKSLLNPALVMIEGEHCGPHKNFIDTQLSQLEERRQIQHGARADGREAPQHLNGTAELSAV